MSSTSIFYISSILSRYFRVIIPEWPYHVTHRGNNKQSIFWEDEDRFKYLRLAKKYSDKWECTILAYSLMPNHVHLLIKPYKDYSLAKAMQGISLCYTQRINRKYQRTGRLWECRYYSSIIDKDSYLWNVIRYIEQNSVRAGLVEKPDDYKWSSSRAHILGIKDPLISTKEILELGDLSRFRDYIRNECTTIEIDTIRRMTRQGLPLGSIEFQRKIESIIKRKIIPSPRGRPRKNG